MANQGIFIVLEGSDGSGKTTQFELLKKRLVKAGYDVETFDFPRYDKPSSHFITKYLNGVYGPAAKVSPYTASLFYALDRFEAAPDIRRALREGKIVLANRYVGSNMAHQGSKFGEPIEKRSFFVWADSLEYQLLGIPRPHLNLFLRVPAEVSFELIGKKEARQYTDKSHDEHEKDLDHLKRTVSTYDLLCQLFPRDFHAIECVDNGKLMSVADIGNVIWSSLKPLLPPLTGRPEAEPTPEAAPTPPAAEKKPASKPAPSEFIWKAPKISYLAAVDIRSRLLPLKLSDKGWGTAQKLEYFVPEGLSKETARRFRRTMDELVKLHSEIKPQLKKAGPTESLLNELTPLAATTSSEMKISRESAAEVVKRLSLSKNDEVRDLATKLSEQLVGVWPEMSSEVSSFEQQQAAPEAIGDIIEKLASDILPRSDSEDAEPVSLLHASPRNEFDLLPQSLKPYSELPLAEITAKVASWDYQQKVKALDIALSKSSPEALQLASYRYEFLTSWSDFIHMSELKVLTDIELNRSRITDDFTLPPEFDDSPAVGSCRQIVEKMSALFAALQAEYDSYVLNYATLLGNSVRWQATVKAADLVAARPEKSVDGLIKTMETLTQEAHPIIGERINAAPKKKNGEKGRPIAKNNRKNSRRPNSRKPKS